MLEILLENNKKIILQETNIKNLPEKDFFINIESSFSELPIELSLNKSVNPQQDSHVHNVKLEVNSFGRVSSIKSLASEIRKGDKVITELMGYTDKVLNLTRENFIKIQQNLDKDEYPIIGFGANVLSVVRSSGVEMGHKVLVLGQGMKGQLLAQICYQCGADISVFDTSKLRLDCAEKSSINKRVITSELFDKLDVDTIHPYGFDIVYVAGIILSESIWEKIWQAVRPAGKIIVLYPQDLKIKNKWLAAKNVTIITDAVNKTWQDYFPGNNLTSPLGYVRWNKRRDLEEFAKMVSDGKVTGRHLSISKFKIETDERDCSFMLTTDNQVQGITFEFA